MVSDYFKNASGILSMALYDKNTGKFLWQLSSPQAMRTRYRWRPEMFRRGKQQEQLGVSDP